MNKLPKSQRQRNFFNSIERIKKELNSKPKADKRPYSRRSEAEQQRKAVVQKEYERQEREKAELRAVLLRAEAAQLQKELDKLFDSRKESE